MNYDSEGWIAVPQLMKLPALRLKYLDILTYTTIRSYMNSEDGTAFPSYETVAKVSGLGRTFVIQSVKRLKKAGLITVTTKKQATDMNFPNVYTFRVHGRYERIPTSFFKAEELDPTEKAMLLCLRQFFIHGGLTTIYSINRMSEMLGLTYSKVYAQIKRLITKGYMSSETKKSKYSKWSKKCYQFTKKIDWIYGQRKARGDGGRTLDEFPRLTVS